MWPASVESFYDSTSVLYGGRLWFVLLARLMACFWLCLCPNFNVVLAKGPTLQPPKSQSVAPGDWVSLAFVVSALDQAIHHELPIFELPRDWSIVVPPRPVSLAKDEAQTLTLAVAVPKTASVGAHEIVMTLGNQSVSAEVSVESRMSLEWLADDLSAQPQRWWPHRPWVGRASLLLTGNQSLEVVLNSRAPAGVVLKVSPTQKSMMPNVPIDVVIEVYWDPDDRRTLPKHLPIAVDVVDTEQQSVLLSRQWLLSPLPVGEVSSQQRPWRLRGFVDWRLDLSGRRSLTDSPSQWGIQGSGHWDQSGEQTVVFSWHKEARWGRYIGFDGKHLRWRVGHQVFVGERLNGLSRWGHGLRSSWQSDESPDAWRVGWIQFYAQDGHGQGADDKKRRTISPWWSWRGWRFAYMNSDSGELGSANKKGGWSLSYQTPTQSIGQQASQSDHWKMHITANRDDMAGRFEYRRRFPDQSRWALMAESIPKDHISHLPAGTRLRMQLHHPLAHDASVQTSFLLSHESSTSQVRHRRYQWMTNYWRPINGLAGHNVSNLQLGLGAAHRRYQASIERRLIERASNSNRIVKESTHRSELSLRIRGRFASWHFSARLDTQGRFGLASHWLQSGVGRWRLSLQNTLRKISLESLTSGPWRWSLALERHKQLVSSNPRVALRLGDAKDGRAGQAMVKVNIAKRIQRGQEWSAALSASLADRRDLMLWLRHRWQAHVPTPVPMIERLVGYHSGHTIAGCARQITPKGSKPVVGAVVFLNEQSMLTDKEGCYRFVGLESGHHHLSIQPNLALAESSGSMATNQNLNTRDWLLTTSDHVDLWLEPAESPSLSATPSSLDGEAHRELVHDWSWVQPARVVVSMDWPEGSPLDQPSREAALNPLRLVGTCSNCPVAHQKRTVKRNGKGQWVVEHLMPGEWRWQWVGALLPDEHEFMETHSSLSVASGQTHTLVWAVRYRPRDVEWQHTEVVELVP